MKGGKTALLALLLRLALLLFAVPAVTALAPQDARANIVCLVVNQGLAFGTAATGTGTINYSCTGYENTSTTVNLCIGLGTPSYPGTASQPIMLQGANNLNYQVFRDAALTQVWTTSLPLSKSVTVGAGIGVTITGSFQFYGRIANGQTAPAGLYQAYFYNTRIGSLPGGSSNCNTNRSNISGLDFTLSVSGTVSNACTVDALANANLGNVVAGATAPAGSTTIRVRCPTGTAYNIGVLPSNNNTAGAGQMSGTGTNTDKIAYQLRRTSSTGPIWGNTATTSSAGNGLGGTGNGSNQDFTVYATAPSSNFRPDTYSDTVRVTVNY
ncbi:MAG: spore coat protein U domain-containing protein [Alteraurantiacibacter sp.]